MVIILLLCVTSTLAHVRVSDAVRVEHKQSLKKVFSSIDGYSTHNHLKVEQNIYDFLNLDDYIYSIYNKNGIDITLYIGYYYTFDKISSAHSPMVCFPAQGWILNKPMFHTVSTGENTVNYAEMEVTLGKTKQFILYWFQAYRNTSPHSHMEKVYALYNRLVHKNGQNALVRISIPLENISREDALEVGNHFIRAFYPGFIRYIQADKPA